MAGIGNVIHAVVKRRCFGSVMACCVVLSGCASNEQLFAEYDRDFCVAAGVVEPVIVEKIIEKEVLRDRVVVKEVPAVAVRLSWDPAVYFDSNCTKLSEASTETLLNNAGFLKKFPLYNVSIRGFTDQHATADYNERLSGKRTRKVFEFLQQQGISTERLVVHAHGESIALSTDASPVADEISRRVEMILLDQHGRPAVTYQRFTAGVDQ
jgi:outer membrane protein OmpA-like peptidoglycan-associated protein